MSEVTRNAGGPSPARHRPVLLREVIRFLDLAPGLTVVDGTVGAGGHSREILKHIGSTGILVGLDRDPHMLELAARNVSGSNVRLHQASYAQLPDILDELGLPTADRVLLDLGLASDQLADEIRGFGFESGGPLDLRFDPESGTPAWQLLEQLDETALADILRECGEERFSRPIAERIVARRQERPVRTARDLSEAVAEALPRHIRKESRKNPATRVFQALRIAVNDELEHLENALQHALPAAVRPGGRVVILTFHSLEDRLVKRAFRDKTLWENLTPKPITATAAEKRINPRSRTAKLRAATRS